MPLTSGTVPSRCAAGAEVVRAGWAGKGTLGSPSCTVVMYCCQVGRETVLPQTWPWRRRVSPTVKPPGLTLVVGLPNQTAVLICLVNPTYQVWYCEPEVPVLPPASWPGMTLPLPVARGSTRSCCRVQATASATCGSSTWLQALPVKPTSLPSESFTEVIAVGRQ